MNKWLKWLVPAAWRETVLRDVELEAASLGRSSWWAGVTLVRIGLRLRVTLTGRAWASELAHLCKVLWRTRGFSATAALTLTLGVGLNLVVFGLVDRALFRALPYDASERLLLVSPTSGDGTRYTAMPRAMVVAVHDRGDFEGVAYTSAFPPEPLAGAQDDGGALHLAGATYNLLDVLGVPVAFGRAFTERDAELALPLAVISHQVWLHRFGGDERVIGSQFGIGPRAVTIIGVLPEGFVRPSARLYGQEDGLRLLPEVFRGAAAPANASAFVVRLPPTMSRAQATGRIKATSADLRAALDPRAREFWPVMLVEPLRAGMVGSFSSYLWLLTLTATALVTLTAVNLSVLLLARARSRVQEVAVRIALGAGRVRVVTLELAQAVAICAVGGAVALGVALLVRERLVDLVPINLRTLVSSGLEPRVLIWSVVVVGLCGVIAGVMPAWTATRADVAQIVGAGGRTSRRGTGAGAARWMLVLEAALGVVLVAASAVVVRSFIGQANADLGYEPHGLHRVIAPSPLTDPDPMFARQRAILADLRGLPGVAQAGFADSTPGEGGAAITGGDWNDLASAGLWQVSEGWLQTFGARLVAGRGIEAGDLDQERPVAVVTRGLTRVLWPDLSPADILGRSLINPKHESRTIVGVVEDLRDAPARGAPHRLFVPAAPAHARRLQFIVRTADGRPPDLRQLSAVLSRHGVTEVRTVPAGSLRVTVLRQPRMQAIIFTTLALVGVGVAAVGLFAVAAFTAAQRRYELGVRAALGATPGTLRWTVLSGVLPPVLWGIVIGIGVSYLGADLVTGLVVAVDARDPGTLLLVAGAMIVSALLAAWIPARRASRVDPVVVLRQQ